MEIGDLALRKRDDGEPQLRQARRLFPFIERIVGDAGYQGPKMAAAVVCTGRWEMEIVRRCDRHRFVVLPKRWIVERTIGRISRNRRLARDFDRPCRIACAFVRMAMIRIMLRRLAAKPSPRIRTLRMGSKSPPCRNARSGRPPRLA